MGWPGAKCLPNPAHGLEPAACVVGSLAVSLYETVLGKEHPFTLTSMNNLANVLKDQGKHKQAEEMHRESLRLRDRLQSHLPH
jgi:Tetratricopeptide repeat